MHHGAESTIELAEAWLIGRSAHTVRAYWSDLAWWTEQLEGILELRELTLVQVAAVLELEHDGSAATVARRVATLRSLLAYAWRVGYIATDLGAGIRPHQASPELAARILEPEQVHAMIAAAADSRYAQRDRVAVRLLYYTGARAAELAALEWRDVRRWKTKARVTLRRTKGGRERTVTVPPSLAGELAELREAHGGRRARGPVLRSRSGSALGSRDLQRIVRELARRAGISEPVSPHWLRHAHATHAMQKGAPLHVVAATLGHASLSSTTRYLHARPAESSGDYL